MYRIAYNKTVIILKILLLDDIFKKNNINGTEKTTMSNFIFFFTWILKLTFYLKDTEV